MDEIEQIVAPLREMVAADGGHPRDRVAGQAAVEALGYAMRQLKRIADALEARANG